MRIEDEIKLDFKDVLIRPKRSTLSSRREVDLQRTYKFKQPSQIFNKQTQFTDYEYDFDIPTSNIFSIMLVFTSTNTSNTPVVKDLRVIAVA